MTSPTSSHSKHHYTDMDSGDYLREVTVEQASSELARPNWVINGGGGKGDLGHRHVQVVVSNGASDNIDNSINSGGKKPRRKHSHNNNNYTSTKLQDNDIAPSGGHSSHYSQGHTVGFDNHGATFEGRPYRDIEQQEVLSSRRKSKPRRHKDVPPIDLSSLASDSEEKTVKKNKRKKKTKPVV